MGDNIHNGLLFDYYDDDQSEQFDFVRIPKLLFTDLWFSNLSYGAKILYGLLLDRMSVAKKEGWIDNSNRVYVIYTLDSIMQNFKVSKPIAIRMLKELEDIGLIDKRRQQNAATLIYIKSFVKASKNLDVQEQDVQNINFQNAGKPRKYKEVNNQDVQDIDPIYQDDDEEDEEDDDKSSSMGEPKKIIKNRINYKKLVADKKYDLVITDMVIDCLVNILQSSKQKYKIDGQKILAKDLQKKILANLSEDKFALVIDNITTNGADTIYNMQGYVAACFYRLHNMPQKTKKFDVLNFNGFANQHDYDIAALEKALLKIR